MSIWGGGYAQYGAVVEQGLKDIKARKDAKHAQSVARRDASDLQLTLSPQLRIIQELFGNTPVYNKSGTRIIRYEPGDGANIFSDPNTVPDSALTPMQRLIRGYIYNKGPSKTFNTTLPTSLGLDAYDAYTSDSMGPLAAVMPYALEAAKTGFRTDMSPIIAEEQRRYRDETLPMLKEQFAPATGLFATDFLGATGREGAAMGSRLGAQQVALDEAAADRRMQGIPLYSAMKQSNIAIPLNLATDFSALGGMLDQSSDAGRLMSMLGLTANLAGGTTAVQPGYPGMSTTSGLGALGSALGGAGGGIGKAIDYISKLWSNPVPQGTNAAGYQTAVNDIFSTPNMGSLYDTYGGSTSSLTDLYSSMQSPTSYTNLFGANLNF